MKKGFWVEVNSFAIVQEMKMIHARSTTLVGEANMSQSLVVGMGVQDSQKVMVAVQDSQKENSALKGLGRQVETYELVEVVDDA